VAAIDSFVRPPFKISFFEKRRVSQLSALLLVNDFSNDFQVNRRLGWQQQQYATDEYPNIP